MAAHRWRSPAWDAHGAAAGLGLPCWVPEVGGVGLADPPAPAGLCPHQPRTREGLGRRLLSGHPKAPLQSPVPIADRPCTHRPEDAQAQGLPLAGGGGGCSQAGRGGHGRGIPTASCSLQGRALAAAVRREATKMPRAGDADVSLLASGCRRGRFPTARLSTAGGQPSARCR